LFMLSLFNWLNNGGCPYRWPPLKSLLKATVISVLD
jgi:hypothetical protein